MTKLLKLFLMAIAVSLFVTYGTAKKPADPGGGGGKVTTQACVMERDIVSHGNVQVGIDVKTYGPQITLELTGTILDGALPGQDYLGYARVLKSKTGSRLDFAFNSDGTECRPVQWEDQYPFKGVCQYELILMDGIYDRRADTVEFGVGARRYLSEYPGGILSENALTDDESVKITFH